MDAFRLLLQLWQAADEVLRPIDAAWMEKAGAHSIESVGAQLYGGIPCSASVRPAACAPPLSWSAASTPACATCVAPMKATRAASGRSPGRPDQHEPEMLNRMVAVPTCPAAGAVTEAEPKRIFPPA